MVASFSRYTSAALTAALLLSGCGGAQPTSISSGTAVQPGTMDDRAQSLSRYYLTKFTTTVGNSLPESSFCFRFKANGTWRNSGSESFSGTYLTSGKELFASAVWLPSPAVYLAVQGSVNTKQGSGHFVVSGGNGSISGGGTYTMRAAQNSTCS